MPRHERRMRGCCSTLMCTLLLFALVSPIERAFSAEPLTVEGEGTGSLSNGGTFSAQLPDGSKCAGTFSNNGTISLLGHSQVPTTASCTNGDVTKSARTLIYRWPNGLPRRATLTFDDGSKVVVKIPFKSSHIMHPVPAAKPTNPWTQ